MCSCRKIIFIQLLMVCNVFIKSEAQDENDNVSSDLEGKKSNNVKWPPGKSDEDVFKEYDGRYELKRDPITPMTVTNSPAQNGINSRVSLIPGVNARHSFPGDYQNMEYGGPKMSYPDPRQGNSFGSPNYGQGYPQFGPQNAGQNIDYGLDRQPSPQQFYPQAAGYDQNQDSTGLMRIPAINPNNPGEGNKLTPYGPIFTKDASKYNAYPYNNPNGGNNIARAAPEIGQGNQRPNGYFKYSKTNAGKGVNKLDSDVPASFPDRLIKELPGQKITYVRYNQAEPVMTEDGKMNGEIIDYNKFKAALDTVESRQPPQETPAVRAQMGNQDTQFQQPNPYPSQDFQRVNEDNDQRNKGVPSYQVAQNLVNQNPNPQNQVPYYQQQPYSGHENFGTQYNQGPPNPYSQNAMSQNPDTQNLAPYYPKPQNYASEIPRLPNSVLPNPFLRDTGPPLSDPQIPVPKASEPQLPVPPNINPLNQSPQYPGSMNPNPNLYPNNPDTNMPGSYNPVPYNPDPNTPGSFNPGPYKPDLNKLRQSNSGQINPDTNNPNSNNLIPYNPDLNNLNPSNPVPYNPDPNNPASNYPNANTPGQNPYNQGQYIEPNNPAQNNADPSNTYPYNPGQQYITNPNLNNAGQDLNNQGPYNPDPNSPGFNNPVPYNPNPNNKEPINPFFNTPKPYNQIPNNPEPNNPDTNNLGTYNPDPNNTSPYIPDPSNPITSDPVPPQVPDLTESTGTTTTEKVIPEVHTETINVVGRDAPQTHQIVVEAKKIMEDLKVGYLTAFAYKLLDILEHKDPRDAEALLEGFFTVIQKMIADGEFDEAGNATISALDIAAGTLSTYSVNIVKSALPRVRQALMHREIFFAPEASQLFDIIDASFTIEEGEKLLQTLVAVNDYPYNHTNSIDVIRNIIDALMLPFHRTAGTKNRNRLVEMVNDILIEKFDFTEPDYSKVARKTWERDIDRRFNSVINKGQSMDARRDNTVDMNRRSLHFSTHKKNNFDDFINSLFIKYKVDRKINPEVNTDKKYKTISQEIDIDNFNEKITTIVSKFKRKDKSHHFQSSKTKALRKERIRHKNKNQQKHAMKRTRGLKTSRNRQERLNQHGFNYEKSLRNRHFHENRYASLKDLLNSSEKVKSRASKKKLRIRKLNKGLRDSGKVSNSNTIPIKKSNVKKTNEDLLNFSKEDNTDFVTKIKSSDPKVIKEQKRFNVVKANQTFENNSSRNKKLLENLVRYKDEHVPQQQGELPEHQVKSKYLHRIFRKRLNLRETTGYTKEVKDKKYKNSILQNIIEESSYSDDEKELKFVLSDAIRHSDFVLRNFRNNEIIKDKKKLHEQSSYSDEEGLIKNNIYKVFGYDPDLDIKT